MKVYLTTDLTFARLAPGALPHPAIMVNVGNIPTVLQWSVRIMLNDHLVNSIGGSELVEPGGRMPVHWSRDLNDPYLSDEALIILEVSAGQSPPNRTAAVTVGHLRTVYREARPWENGR